MKGCVLKGPLRRCCCKRITPTECTRGLLRKKFIELQETGKAIFQKKLELTKRKQFWKGAGLPGRSLIQIAKKKITLAKM